MNFKNAGLVLETDELSKEEVMLGEIPIDLFAHRPSVEGKFLYIGEKKFYVRGVTYGTFQPQEDGQQFPSPAVVAKDFEMMRKNEVNCVRVYTVPPKWLLDCAQRNGLRVMGGLPWEQHITFLDDPKRANDIEQRIRDQVRKLNRHPAILMYIIGNEIPPTIVRWYGREKIEAFLKRLYKTVKQEDPEGLVTYVNFPTTEYLQLNFLDLISFNVYLEKKEVLEAYLARLQNLSGEKPIIMAEIGLDSQRNGQEKQAASLDWQIKSVFASGCAGMFIFAWTDEWYRGGSDIDDWDFGLTTRNRMPKQALSVIKNNFANVPFPWNIQWPRISVFICSCNGAKTIRQTLTALSSLNYPDYEIVVVNDGSKDNTAQIAKEFKIRLISTENRGLSVARNEALKDEAAPIVVYIDDDAYPDPDWLKYIAYTFLTTDFMAVGGPNLLPLESGVIANCVGNAPGGPTHVLINDRVAEHIPGCNMAYRKAALKAIGGFDGQFRSAGDDVDVCWRIQKMGWEIGYHPAAYVWHYRRSGIKTYWKQQYGYGKAEAMLEDKWPEKYNAIGHIPWSGRLYGNGQTVPLFSKRWRVYQGVWGSAPFQSIYQPSTSIFFSVPLLPEWYLLISFLGVLTVSSIFWEPLLAIAPVFVISIIVPIIQAIASAGKAEFTINKPSFSQKIKLYGITAFLHLLQPLARLRGRLAYGLTPFKCRGEEKLFIPRVQIVSIWQEKWQSSEEILTSVETELKKQNARIHRGGTFDNWDLEVRGGILGAARFLLTVEEHGQGKQMLRFRVTPNFKIRRTWIILLFAGLAILAGVDKAWVASAILGGVAICLTERMLQKCAYAKASIFQALSKVEGIYVKSMSPRVNKSIKVKNTERS